MHKAEASFPCRIQAQADGLVVDRALGAYLGLAVGDALGATVEFMTASEIAATYRIHKQIIGGGCFHVKAGQVTDDTEMALALGGAVVASEGWDLRAIAEAFVAWMRGGPVDVGNTCRRGICHYISTGSLSVPASEGDGGNGAAMRNLPTVLASLESEALLIQRSVEQAHITHNHSKSDAATVALARMTRQLVLEGGAAACNHIAKAFTRSHPEFRFKPWPGRTTGYIVDTVQTVFDAFFNTGSFEDCVVRAVNRGGDADTTGALAGQLAGALYGIEGIPAHWLRKLNPSVTAKIYDQTQRLLSLSFPVT